ncbi:PqiC family protein [Pigmentiphaga humi]|uniref:PqiC family protein n=1 Tax=Pigmentiphaga humi TaxID=2478468 RepID=UPI00135CC189|nr:PqiC family protein [Pigmentiphaga humi]
MSKFVRMAAALAAAAGAGGCAAPQAPAIYTLQAEQPAPADVSGPALVLDVAPVALPERLQRRQIVLREDGAQVQMLDRHRWSAPLGDELHDALSSALQARLHAVDAAKAGLAGKAAYRVNVEFSRLDAKQGGAVRAAVSWSVRPLQGGRALVCLGTFEQAAAGGSVADVVVAHQGMLGRVADAVAASVRAAGGSGVTPNCSPA